jgi:hypothetical protein
VRSFAISMLFNSSGFFGLRTTPLTLFRKYIVKPLLNINDPIHFEIGDFMDSGFIEDEILKR